MKRMFIIVMLLGFTCLGTGCIDFTGKLTRQRDELKVRKRKLESRVAVAQSLFDNLDSCMMEQNVCRRQITFFKGIIRGEGRERQ